MKEFPFFKCIEGAQALIVGGGKVALRKARALTPFGVRLRVVAPVLDAGMAELGAICERRAFIPEDLDGAQLVVAATDDRAVNAQVARLCRERGIEVNVADDPEAGTFHFPAMLNRGTLTVAVSTGGASPIAAGYLMERIQTAVPEQIEAVLDCMESARRRVKERISDPAVRRDALVRAFARCLEDGPLPDAAEMETLLFADDCGGRQAP